ncbi:hypothetical protein [Myxosarcina sp. GI1(2024)]
MNKKYYLTIEVDPEQLISSYTGNDDTIYPDELPDLDELVAFELNWVAASGIHIKEIEEIKE